MLSRRLLASIAALGLAACRRETAPTPPAGPVTVQAARVELLDLANTITIAGELRAYREVDLHAKVAGYLRAILVDIGDHVQAGQVIARLEAPEQEQERAQAEAAEKRARLDIERAKGDLARAEATVRLRQNQFQRLDKVARARPNLIAKQEIDDARSHLDEAEAQSAALKGNLAAVEQQVAIAHSALARVEAMGAYLTITAPFAGVITQRFADPGAMIQAGTTSQSQARPVVRLAEIDRLRLVVPVPETLVGTIQVGSPLTGLVAAAHQKIVGRVARFTSSINSVSRAMETQIDVPNAGRSLKPGMMAEVTFPTAQANHALAVPVQAAREREGKFFVLVVNAQGVVEERAVHKGLETADKVQLLDGVREGEVVITAAATPVKAGQTVTPQLPRPAQPAAPGAK
ncbi:MAG: efflux RND transporter periplasmic adaptor subunit [Acidobacteria bacterium]|nr:efflux RND transporter periplasmic adaptor subunit [Acidobacteriota bacterium]